MDLEDFRELKIGDVHAAAEAYKDFRSTRFTLECADLLADAEEIQDFVPCHFEGVGNRNRQMRIDGYARDESDDSMNFLVTEFSDAPEMAQLGKTEMDRILRTARYFVEEAIEGRLTTGPAAIEEVEEVWGLASDLSKLRLAGEDEKVRKFRIFLVTDLVLSNRVKEIAGEEISGIPVEFHVWDIDRFFRAWSTTTGRDDIEVDFREFGGPIATLQTGGAQGEFEGYLCMIPGLTLARVYERFGGRLLEGNVRSFLTNKQKVNRGIQLTIAKEPTRFFAYNNGISATASEVRLSDDGQTILSAKNLQIVNGGQTTASVALALEKGTDNTLAMVYVQMKLSVVNSEISLDLIPKISRFANSQTKINEADFFANHPYHVRLQELSEKVWAPASDSAQYQTRWYYERARGQYDNETSRMPKAAKSHFILRHPKSQLVKKVDVAKVANTFRGLPQIVSLGNERNFRAFAQWIGPEWDRDSTVYHDDYFRRLIGQVILFRETEAIVSDAEWYQGGYRANVVTYTLALLQHLVQKQAKGMSINLGAIWNLQQVPAAIAKEIKALAFEIYNVLTDPNRPKDNVTEWARSAQCWIKAQEVNHSFSSAFLATLEDAGYAKTVDRENKKLQATLDYFSIVSDIVKIGQDKWMKLSDWGVANKLLTGSEFTLLRAAINSRRSLPTEKQGATIWDIRERLVGEGFDREAISVPGQKNP